jgi:hypothetical protein
VSFYPPHSPRQQVEAFLASCCQTPDAPLAELLTPQRFEQLCAEHDTPLVQAARVVFTPLVTLWAWLGAVLSPDHSCRAAVARVLTLSLALGRAACSLDTAAYCRARARLSTALVRQLALDSAAELEAAVPPSWLWSGRHVHLVDGSTSTLPDTPAHRRRYSQHPNQLPGVGFPLVRWVLLASLATAMIGGCAFGPYSGKETGETALFRQLHERLRAGDVLLADRYFCNYFLVAMLRARGVDVVARLHALRDDDCRRGHRLGRGQRLMYWRRPARPAWLTPELYATMPQGLWMREVRVHVTEPGFRTERLTIATTLLDPRQYSREAVGELSRQRWHVELDIRALKTYLGMEQLRCQSPEMVAKEIWVHVLAYNLVRKTTAQAALAHGFHPRQVSFTAAKQVGCGAALTLVLGDAEQRARIVPGLLAALRSEVVGERPNRVEPRRVKRRPKPHRWLTEPRAQARARLLRT